MEKGEKVAMLLTTHGRLESSLQERSGSFADVALVFKMKTLVLSLVAVLVASVTGPLSAIFTHRAS